ncbi:hypothetical protein [Paraglaciecola sp.]|uniref:hypothetical protein n=1 Tax=Paraglaciecola sp. TaxID=1920173 RepID=UPI0032658538
MITTYETGYFRFPSFSLIKRTFQLSAEYFEWSFMLLLVLGFFLSSWHDAHIAKLIVEKPQRNDFFLVDYYALNKDSDIRHRYVPMKVLEVKSDSIVFKVGGIAHSTKVSVDKHVQFDKPMLDNFYRKQTLELSFSKIADFFQIGTIYSAARPRNIYINGWIVMHESEL